MSDAAGAALAPGSLREIHRPDGKDACYIGLISGTSMDGIDAAAFDFSLDESPPRMLTSHRHGLDQGLVGRLRQMALQKEPMLAADFGQLDAELGNAFAAAATELLDQLGPSTRPVAIGSHGQTLRHGADADPPFTLQLGDPNRIAQATSLPVVADFRRRDLAAGGQGAPLAPAFHRAFLSQADSDVAVINLGGIANITWLPAAPDGQVTGFDSGPANGLLDALAREYHRKDCDQGGEIAAMGEVDQTLLERLLDDPFFARKPPRSTGFEYFNLDWLQQRGGADRDWASPNAMATVVELTVQSVSRALNTLGHARAVYLCGGGVHNRELVERLKRQLAPAQVTTTAALGLDPDWVEAATFAWLAGRTLAGLVGNLPSVTGASAALPLGAVYPASDPLNG